MTHKGSPGHGEMVVLADLAQTLLAELPQHDAGRAARTIAICTGHGPQGPFAALLSALIFATSPGVSTACIVSPVRNLATA